MSGTGNSVLDDTLDLAVNHLTFGLAGYDAKNGGFKAGIVTHALDEGIGEIDGRNRARDVANKQQAAIDQERANAATDLANQQKKKQDSDIQASFAARGMLTPQTNAQNLPAFGPNVFSGGQTLGGDKQTFLGV